MNIKNTLAHIYTTECSFILYTFDSDFKQSTDYQYFSLSWTLFYLLIIYSHKQYFNTVQEIEH